MLEAVRLRKPTNRFTISNHLFYKPQIAKASNQKTCRVKRLLREYPLDDFLFRVSGRIDFALVRVHVTLEPDGSQYEYYASKGVTPEKFSGASSGSSHWTRSVCLDGSQYFRYVYSNGDWSNHGYTATDFVFPAWCF